MNRAKAPNDVKNQISGLDGMYKLRTNLSSGLEPASSKSTLSQPLPYHRRLIDLVTSSAEEGSGQAPSENNTGIPLQMKESLEEKSGLSFDDVKVHYNSEKPEKFQALAYTQGNQVYMGPGQEEHLGHELGHVVQQKLGKVKPTGLSEGVRVNEDTSLEKEAEEYGREMKNVEGAGGQREQAAEAVQFLKGKAGIPNFEQSLQNTVYAYAVLNGTGVGLFTSNSSGHAETNLLNHVNTLSYGPGSTLDIILSASPCSSSFGTSKKSDGCAEEIEEFKRNHPNITVKVYAHHPYQPKDSATLADLDGDMKAFVQAGMKEAGHRASVPGFVSYSAAAAYDHDITKTYNGQDIIQY